MKTWIFSLCLALASSTAMAEFANYSMAELVDQTSLIVVGTLVEVEESSDGTTDSGKGVIRVEEILKGPEKLVDRTLHWNNLTIETGLRMLHKSHEGIKAVWLLELKADGSVTANHPGRFVDLKHCDEVKKLITGAGKTTDK